jgi:C_GCAxxG_C_C family probable redox protein
MTKAELAREIFESDKAGCNCSQAVLCAYADDFFLDQNHAKAVATGVGGGLADNQGPCGTVCGGIMVLGLRYGSREHTDRAPIEATKPLVRQFQEEFRKAWGSTKCADILAQCPLPPDEKAKFEAGHKHKEPCYRALETTIGILEKML